MTPFICPVCSKTCPTLREFLSCHPREVRAATGLLETDRFASYRLATLYGGSMSLTLYLAALDSLESQVVTEAAA